MQPRAPVLTQATFDPKLKTYWMLETTLALVATIVGIVLVPFWLLFGRSYVDRRYESLACILTERSLIVRSGVFIKTEKTIPLNKIQDFSLKEGPLLRRLGLAKLDIETAGQSSGQGESEAALVGIQDVYQFRDRVLEQAEQLEQRESVPEDGKAPTETDTILIDIRDSLLRIEKRLTGPSKNVTE